MDNNKNVKNVFLTDDIEKADYEMPQGGTGERYEFTERLDNFLEYAKEQAEDNSIYGMSDEVLKTDILAMYTKFEADPSKAAQEVREWIEAHDETQAIYDAWREGISYEEQYEVPMMTMLRYFPSFVSFEEADRYKVASATTLLYDSEREAWAVGMTGGGMDLSPHLVATFVNLGKGVPTELASAIRRDYAGYIKEDTHRENCDLLAEAYARQGLRSLDKYMELRHERGSLDYSHDPMHRHIIAIQKTLESAKK